MCTVTWTAVGDGYVVYMNRDELASRGSALPPSPGEVGGRRYLAPTDSDGGGTWIAATECGLTVGLLNRYPAGHAARASGAGRHRGYRSRGLLVVDLVACENVPAVADALARLRLESYRPFTLFAVSAHDEAAVWRWDGRGEPHRVSEPQPPLSSSSYDGEAVVARRTETYARIVGATPTVARLERYHASHEPVTGPYSVCAHRDDGGSRSLTRVLVSPRSVTMRYHAGPPCEPAPETEVELPRRL